MSLSFSAASIEDIPVIFAQAKALIDAYEDISAIDYDKVMDWMKRKITAQIADYTCVRSGMEKCAYYHLSKDGELDDLYVLSPFRGQGIGFAIVQKCIAESAKPLWLYAFTKNRRAIALYERFGFRIREAVGETRVLLALPAKPEHA